MIPLRRNLRLPEHDAKQFERVAEIDLEALAGGLQCNANLGLIINEATQSLVRKRLAWRRSQKLQKHQLIAVGKIGACQCHPTKSVCLGLSRLQVVAQPFGNRVL